MDYYYYNQTLNPWFQIHESLASQELNPMIIPPDILKDILHKIETDIKSHARRKTM